MGMVVVLGEGGGSGVSAGGQMKAQSRELTQGAFWRALHPSQSSSHWGGGGWGGIPAWASTSWRLSRNDAHNATQPESISAVCDITQGLTSRTMCTNMEPGFAK